MRPACGGSLAQVLRSCHRTVAIRVSTAARQRAHDAERDDGPGGDDPPRCAVLSTVGADGAPRQIVIHYLLGVDHLLINGHHDRRWVANLRRDPRVSLIVHDQADHLHYVSLRGTATLLDESEPAVADAMRQAERYGEDPPNRTPTAGQLQDRR
jgi:PPOX class probable F420-dependent enzyme